MTFLIVQSESELEKYNKDKILFVDGSLDGFRAYDHHLTGEKINLDAMPDLITDMPEIVVTKQIDTDAICSGVVVYFGGEKNLDSKYIQIFRSASHYCDYLIADEQINDEINEKGLGLHLYLKEKGVNYLKIYPEITNTERSIVFEKLCYSIIDIIKKSKILPSDKAYLKRIEKQIITAKDSIIHKDNLVTVISSRDFIDPIAAYKVIDTPLLILQTPIDKGINKFSIGVNPDFYIEYNIKGLFEYINNNYEKGWGGRNIAGGGPFKGSILPINKIIEILHIFKNELMFCK